MHQLDENKISYLDEIKVKISQLENNKVSQVDEMKFINLVKLKTSIE